MIEKKNWGSKHEAAPILNCAPRTVKNYRDRKDLIENVHWRKRGATRIEYNLVLLQDYMKNLNNPEKHLKVCKGFYR
jgi:hypothetical protein